MTTLADSVAAAVTNRTRWPWPSTTPIFDQLVQEAAAAQRRRVAEWRRAEAERRRQAERARRR